MVIQNVSAPKPPAQPSEPAGTDEAVSIAEMRMESIKAGLLGAGAIGLVAGIAWAITRFTPIPLPLPNSPLAWLINLAVALSSGFFFGVTYRYIVRTDDNLHLGSGAVGAFALVRSLGQIEATWDDSFAFITWLLVTGESFLWFATARYTLDWAIGKRWITPLD
ncbi:MAG: hypothetical protein AAFV46_11770 [Cyanobacteria bacterium J06635_11]